MGRKINFGLEVKTPHTKIGIPKSRLFNQSKKLLNMNWKQTQRRFPGLNPMGDLDFDGTRNKYDCKPLDPSRDGKVGEAVAKVMSKFKSAGKTIAKEAPKRFKIAYGKIKTDPRKYSRRIGTPAKKSQAKTHARPGRPKASFKHRHPLTGKPIPAPEFYQVKKSLRRRAKQQAELAQLKQQQYLAAKYGIPPQITKMRQEAQMKEFKPSENNIAETTPVQTMPIQRAEEELPEQVRPEMVQQEVREVPEVAGGTYAYVRPRYKVVTDVMTGRRIIKPLPQPERWASY